MRDLQQTKHCEAIYENDQRWISICIFDLIPVDARRPVDSVKSRLLIGVAVRDHQCGCVYRLGALHVGSKHHLMFSLVQWLTLWNCDHGFESSWRRSGL